MNWDKFRSGWLPIICVLGALFGFGFTMGKNHRLPQPYYNLISCSGASEQGDLDASFKPI